MLKAALKRYQEGGCSYGLILIIYLLPYPKAVGDSMQKEIRHKQKKYIGKK